MQCNSQAILRNDLEAFEHGAGRRRRQVAEGIAHEAFEAGDAAVDQSLQVLDGVLRKQAVEAVIDVRLLCRLLLEGKRLRVFRGRIDVGHLEHGGDAPCGRRRGSGLPVLLVRIAGLAEVDMHVDCPRQQMQAAGVEYFARARHGGLFADRQYAAVLDRDGGIE